MLLQLPLCPWVPDTRCIVVRGEPESGLFDVIRSVIRERRAARVRVVCDPPRGRTVTLRFASGSLVGVESGELPPADALELLACARTVTYTCAPAEPTSDRPLMHRDSLHTWLVARGTAYPRVLPEPPEGGWTVRRSGLRLAASAA